MPMRIMMLMVAYCSGLSHPLCDDTFLFAQLLAGHDVARPRDAVGAEQQKVFSMAKGMQNFMYLVGDRNTRECIAIDACYDPKGVVAAAEALGCNVTAAIGTHFHYDHIGHAGLIPMGPGLVLPGLDYFVRELEVPSYVHAVERDTAAMQIGVSAAALSELPDVVNVGAVAINVVHTPGHSPGGVTLVVVVDGEESTHRRSAATPTRNSLVPPILRRPRALVPRTCMKRRHTPACVQPPHKLPSEWSCLAGLALTGDTVFPGSCGRLDLPGASVDAMYDSLQTLRERLVDDTLPLFPGHAYSGMSSTVGREKESGVLRPVTRAQWRRAMSHNVAA